MISSIKKRATREKLSWIMAGLAAVVVILFLWQFLVAENIAVTSPRENSGYFKCPVDLSAEVSSSDAPAGVIREYYLTVPEKLDSDTHFAYYVVHQYTQVLLDGELIYSLFPHESSNIGKTIGSNWVMIPLCREDAGAQLCVRFFSVYDGAGSREPTFWIGSQMGLYADIMASNLPQMILAGMAVFVGVIFIAIAGYTAFRWKRGRSLLCLGLFAVIMGIWRLADTRFSPMLIAEKPTFLFYCSITMLMLGAIPLMLSIKNAMGKVGRRILEWGSILTAAVCIGQILLQMLNVMDLREYLFITHIVIGIDAIFLLGNALYEICCAKKSAAEKKQNILPLICAVGVILDVAVFYLLGTSNGLIFSLSAFLLYTICSGFVMMLDYAEQGKRLKEQELELLKNRTAIMLSQIQPHFLYNSLSAIRELCRNDPEEAREALLDFTTYLRGNMDSLKSERPIHFSKELQHIQTYLHLEKLRFGDELQVSYDIREEDFFLPSLTVQPLIENAVKHGICAREEGGRVTLQTFRRDDHIVIRVIDDGVGFDVKKTMDSTHVGIRNVRHRLKTMANAQLQIESDPKTGTVVTVLLPVNRGD